MSIAARTGLLSRRKALSLLLLLAARPAGAHEFWLLPNRYRIDSGAAVSLRLLVGQDFTGDDVGIGTSILTRAEHYTHRGKVDLSLALPRSLATSAQVRLVGAGTHLIALDTNPSLIELPGPKFNEYLALEGLDAVLQARAAAGLSGTSGRERYRRNVKTLIQVAGASDATFARRTGQRLEIVPLADPFTLAPGDTMRLQVFFDGVPLQSALVKLWRRDASGLTALQGRTDPQGRMQAVLPAAGEWMASVVHMIPASAGAEVDWESYWGNLTFAMGA